MPPVAGSLRVLTLSAVTVITSVVMVFILLSEIRLYFTVDIEDEVRVDSTHAEDNMAVSIDMTFFHLKCDGKLSA